jgi:Fe2+ or Zn2+ uptake regulation protein
VATPRTRTRPRAAPAAAATREPQRRNRTRQRERILELVGESHVHPTASAIHHALLAEFPRLSLGTVYRNLDVLVGEGRLRAVPVPSGATRFDGNLGLHHHFVCEACGAIQDVDVRLPAGLAARVRRRYRVQPERFRVDFYGRCRSCAERPVPNHS